MSSLSSSSSSSSRCTYICLSSYRCAHSCENGDEYCSQHTILSGKRVEIAYNSAKEYPLSVERVLLEHPVIPLDIIRLVSDYSQPYLTIPEISDYLLGKTKSIEILRGIAKFHAIKELFKFITDNHVFQRSRWRTKFAKTCMDKLEELEMTRLFHPDRNFDWIQDVRALCLADLEAS